jgi:hypothetical protein
MHLAKCTEQQEINLSLKLNGTRSFGCGVVRLQYSQLNQKP